MPPQGLPGQGLPGYGLLIGKIVGARLQRSGSAHLLLFVQPGNADHPTYRVAVNLQSTDRHHVSDLQYQVVDFGSRSTRAATALVGTLRRLGATPAFLTAASESIPRLDFVRGGIIDPNKFKDLPTGANPLRQTFEKALADAAAA